MKIRRKIIFMEMAVLVISFLICVFFFCESVYDGKHSAPSRK